MKNETTKIALLNCQAQKMTKRTIKRKVCSVSSFLSFSGVESVCRKPILDIQI